MKKEDLLKNIREASHKSHFSLVLERSSIGDESSFENLVRELQEERKIKIREYSKKEDKLSLTGFLKYASE
jgi:hypothetical protein